MTYVDGYVLVVKEENMKAYKKMAKEAAEIWIKHGALRYMECKGDDMHPEWCKLPFPKLMKTKEDENVLYSFVTYKNKAHRDKVNKKVMAEMSGNPEDCEGPDVPFDIKRMAFGGFSSFVDMQSDD